MSGSSNLVDLINHEKVSGFSHIDFRSIRRRIMPALRNTTFLLGTICGNRLVSQPLGAASIRGDLSIPLAMIAVGSVLSAPLASAQTYSGSRVPGSTAIADSTCSTTATTAAAGALAINCGATASAADAVAIGSNANASNPNDVFIGNRAGVGFVAQGIVTGTGANPYNAADYRVVNGRIVRAIDGSTPTAAEISNFYIQGGQVRYLVDNTATIVAKPATRNNIGIGLNVGLGSTGQENIAMGNGASNNFYGTDSISIGKGANSFSSLTRGFNSVAVGSASMTSADNAVAIGNSAVVAPGSNSLVTTTSADGGIAIGGSSGTYAPYSIAMGYGSKNYSAGSTAIGTFAYVGGGGINVAIGYGAAAQRLRDGTDTTGSSAIAIGDSARAYYNISTAIGSNATAGQLATAIGSGATATGDTSFAFANGSYTDQYNGMAMGPNARAVGGYMATSLGEHAVANANSSLAIGPGSYVSGRGSGAFGATPTTNTFHSRDYGSGTANSSNLSMVLANNSYAVGNGNLIGSSSTGSFAMGNNVRIGATSAAVVQTTGTRAGLTTYSYSTTQTGIQAVTDAVGIGNSAQVWSSGGIALGLNAIAGNSANAASSGNAIAIGAGASATASKSIAIGFGNVVTGASSAAIGDPNYVSGSGTYVIGNNNGSSTQPISTNDSFLLGSNIQQGHTLDHSVNLGTASMAYSALSGSTAGTTAYSSGTIGGVSYSFGGGTNTPFGVVTVGQLGLERRVENVATGLVSSSSTDAINGSQLYATNLALGNLAASAAANLGGGVRVNPDGSISAPAYSIHGPIYNDVGSALAAATSEVLAGTNIADVTQDFGVNGQAVYTVNAYGTTASAGSGYVAVTSSGPDANHVTNYAVDVAQSVKDATEAALNSGLTFTDDIGATSDLKKLGDRVAITGDSNLTTVANPNGVQVTLNTNLDLGATGSVALGNTHVSNTGVNIVGGPQGAVSLTNTGLDNGGNVIKNVAAGSAATDAVNVSQLLQVQAAATSSVAQGSGILVSSAINANGSTTFTVSVDTAPLVATAGGAISTPATPSQLATASSVADAINNSGWNLMANGSDGSLVRPGDTVDLQSSDGNLTISKAGNSVAFGLANSVVIGATNAVTIDGNAGVVSGLSNTTFDPNAVYTGGVAATQEQLASATSRLSNLGLDYMGDRGTAAHLNLGQQLNIQGGASGNLSDGNIGVVADGNNTLSLKLAQNIDLGTDGSVALGNTQISNAGITADSLTINGGPIINNAGIAMSGDKITGLAAGVLSVSSSEAVNGSQLFSVGTSVAASLGGGSTFDPVSGTVTPNLTVSGNSYANVQDALNAVSSTASAGWNVATSAIGTGSATATGASTRVGAGGTATYVAGNNVSISQDGTKLTVALQDDIRVNSVTAGVVNAQAVDVANGPVLNANGINMRGTRITNLAAGVGPTDAVNVSQLSAGLAGTLASANSYTNAAIDKIAFNLQTYNRDANGGTAAAMAIGQVPQAFEPGMGIAGVGVSTWMGQQAFALGYSKASDNGRVVIRATGSFNTRGQGGAAAGVGLQF